MSRRRTVGALGAAGAGIGGALAAAAASLCCVGPVIAPLIIAVLGAGGAAWAASLQPYSPYLLLGSALLVGYAFWSIYRRKDACDVDEVRSDGRRRGARVVVWITWLAAAIWLVALGLNLNLLLS